MPSPTQRTLAFLRDKGMKCAIVEKFNRFAGSNGQRQDMFGIIDIVALDKKYGVIGVQSCGTAFSQHVKKLHEERLSECKDWLETPGTRLVLIGWRKLKAKRGGKQMVYKPRIQWFTIEDFK